MWACAEALREEYLAITGAGLIVQIDEPSFAEAWDQFNPEPTLEDYRAFTMVRIEALNHALRDIPRELTRFHCCWGSWHGPHTTDIPMADLVDMLLQVNVGAYSFEAANVRHEHEWRAWEGAELDGRVLVPGIVSHATNVVEHPRAGGRPHRALRRRRGARERHRRHRLRAGRARPSADRVGQAGDARGGRTTGACRGALSAGRPDLDTWRRFGRYSRRASSG